MAESFGDFLPWTFADVDLDQPAMNAARTLRLECKESRYDILQEFIHVICEDESIPRPYLDKDFLMRFLRRGKFKIDIAHKRLKKYYDTKRNHPEIFQDYLPSSTQAAQSLNHISVLPYRARDNSIIMLYKLGKLDPSVATLEEIFRLDLLVLETLLLNPVTQLCGVTLLVDATGFSILLHASQFTPKRMKTTFELYHSCNSLAITNVHAVNAPGIANSFFELLQSHIMNQKIKDRIFSHPCGSWESLHSHLPPEILPEDFSGYLKQSELVSVYDLVNYNEPYFLEQLLIS